MKKYLLLITVFMFMINFYDFSLAVNKKNDTGCVAGKINVQLTKRYYGVKPGIYADDIKMKLVKNDNSNDFIFANSKNGYFYFNDVPAGNYKLVSFDLRHKVIEDEVSISAKIVNYPVTVYPEKVTVLQNISVKFRVSDKMFVVKDDFDFIYEPADMNELKISFEKKYKKTNKWKNYIWELNSSDKKSEYAVDANEEKIKALILKADSDLATMDSQFAKGEYLMAMHYNYRILETIIKAYYIKRINENPPIANDLLELAKLAKLELTNDNKMLLIDVTEFNTRSGTVENEETFSKLFTREYVNNYVMKINDFLKYVKSKL